MRRDESPDITHQSLHQHVWNKSWLQDCRLLRSRTLEGKTCLARHAVVRDGTKRTLRSPDATHQQ